jgi:taurine--2-oxoglutarate transaminase
MSDERYPYFFTWSAQRGARPVHITGGQGAQFTTADGATWLDLGSLSYQANLGHGERRVIEAIQRQAGELCLTMPSAQFPAKQALAERLLALAPPGFDRVFFTLGGAEANENAIKMARLFTGRHKLVSRYRSYHGASMGALTLSGDWRRVPLEPGLAGVVHAMDCYCDRCPFGQVVDSCRRECARHIDELLALEGGVAAVILEPVPGANGVLVPPPEYWPMVRQACDRHGALLIADEVLTGFGRTGRCFAIEHHGVVPDMITLAKGVTGGYAPLGAVLVHQRVSAHFDEQVLACGLTAYAHPLGCAAALAALDVYRDDQLFARADALAPAFLGQLRALRDALPGVVTAVRGLGLLAALELALAPAGLQRLAAELAARHISTHLYPRTSTLVLAPPLCIDEAALAGGIAAVGEALRAASRATGEN